MVPEVRIPLMPHRSLIVLLTILCGPLAPPVIALAAEPERHPPTQPPIVSSGAVMLLPPVGGGEGGWCLALGERDGCGALDVPGSPIIDEEWLGESPFAVAVEYVLARNERATLPVGFTPLNAARQPLAQPSIDRGPGLSVNPVPTR